jgi:CBS domain containing-hemolysin-like protein
MTNSDVLLRLLSVLLLIILNAFFVMAEFSLVSVRRSRINQLVAAGDIPARTVQRLQRSIDRVLSTTQIGITLSSLALGWIGQSTIAVSLKKLITFLPFQTNISPVFANYLAIPLAFLLLVYLQIVLGELCPKSIALLYPEQTARFFGTPSLTIARLFKPFIWILDRSTRFLLKIVGIEYTKQQWYDRVTSEELQLTIANDKESTGLEAQERQLLNNVFEFNDVLAQQIAIPRTKIVAIDINATCGTLLETVATKGFSRYPVIGESLDDIRGTIDFKNIAIGLARGEINPEMSIQPWLESVSFLPELSFLSDLLTFMRRAQLKVVILIDEFGGTSGLITLEDLTIQLTGNLDDVSTSLQLQRLDDHNFLIEASMNLVEVNEALNLNLPLKDEYQTLGGFLIYQWQKIPSQGEILHYDNLEFTIVSAQNPKLLQIRLHLQQSIEE